MMTISSCTVSVINVTRKRKEMHRNFGICQSPNSNLLKRYYSVF